MTDTLSRNIWISLAGHALVALLVFFQTVFAPVDPLEIRNAIRVDIVGLPDKIQSLSEPVEAETPLKTELPPKELPKKETAPPPKSEAPQVPSPKARKATLEKSQNKALNQIKALQALDKIQ